MKLRASPMLAKSVVTKLLTSPTRLSEDFDFPFEDEWSVLDSEIVCLFLPLPGDASSPASSVVLAPATEAESGVPTCVASPSSPEDCPSAFIRIRSECSKTSCVIIPSVRTSVLVCITNEKSHRGREKRLTYREIIVQLVGDRGNDGPQEQPRYPYPGTDRGARSAILEVPEQYRR